MACAIYAIVITDNKLLNLITLIKASIPYFYTNQVLSHHIRAKLKWKNLLTPQNRSISNQHLRALQSVSVLVLRGGGVQVVQSAHPPLEVGHALLVSRRERPRAQVPAAGQTLLHCLAHLYVLLSHLLTHTKTGTGWCMKTCIYHAAENCRAPSPLRPPPPPTSADVSMACCSALPSAPAPASAPVSAAPVSAAEEGGGGCVKRYW